jgi:O-antigen ligase
MVTAQSYFLPWHIDNLLLELLIERGLLGLLLFGALLGAALWQLTLGGARHAALAPYQAAALLGVLCVGATGSLLDVPRVALLVYVLALDALLSPAPPA